MLNEKTIEIINSNHENRFQTGEMLEEDCMRLLRGSSKYEDVFFFLNNQANQGERQIGECALNGKDWVVYTQGGQNDAYFAFKRDTLSDDNVIYGCYFTNADLARTAEENPI